MVIDGALVRYTPAPGMCGPDSFDYVRSGGDSATVTVTVACLFDEIFTDGFED